jgi:hypothetical protein
MAIGKNRNDTHQIQKKRENDDVGGYGELLPGDYLLFQASFSVSCVSLTCRSNTTALLLSWGFFFTFSWGFLFVVVVFPTTRRGIEDAPRKHKVGRPQERTSEEDRERARAEVSKTGDTQNTIDGDDREK